MDEVAVELGAVAVVSQGVNNLAVIIKVENCFIAAAESYGVAGVITVDF